jgi:Flp pilus assembly protein TadD
MALRAAELDSDSNTLYLAANALIDRGDFASAILKLRQVVRMDPNDAQAFCSLGVAYQQSGQLDQARLQYDQALKLDPRNASANNNLGALLVATEDWDQAQKYIRRALEINPRYAKAHHNLGVVLTKQRKWQEAVASLQRATEIDPNFAKAHQDLGSVQRALGAIDQTVFHYRRALQLNPKLLATANDLAWLLATSPDASIRNGPEAVRWARHCAEATEYKQPGVFNTLAAALAEAGDFAEAVHWQTKAMQQAPESMQSSCRQRLALYESGQPLREQP